MIISFMVWSFENVAIIVSLFLGIVSLIVGNNTENQRASWIIAGFFGAIIIFSLGGSIISSRLAATNRDLEATRVRNVTKIEDLSLDNTTLQSAVAELREQVQNFTRNNSNLARTNESLKQQIEKLGVSNSQAINDDLKNLREQNLELTTENSELQEAVTTLNNQISTLQEQTGADSVDETPSPSTTEVHEEGTHLEFWQISESNFENPSALPNSPSIARLRDSSNAFKYTNFLASGEFNEYEGQPLTLKWTGKFGTSTAGTYSFYNSLYVNDNPNACESGFGYNLYIELIVDGETVLTNSTYRLSTEDNPVTSNSSLELESGNHDFELWYGVSWTRYAGFLGCYDQYFSNLQTEVQLRAPDADVPTDLIPSDLFILESEE